MAENPTISVDVLDGSVLEAYEDAQLEALSEYLRQKRSSLKDYHETISRVLDVRLTRRNLFVKLARMSDAELRMMHVSDADIAAVDRIRQGLPPATGDEQTVGVDGVEGREAVGGPGR